MAAVRQQKVRRISERSRWLACRQRATSGLTNRAVIVISELGYCLGPADLDQLADRLLASMQPAATVLACHWRQPIKGCVMGGDAVHQRLAQRLALPHLAGYVDDDLRLDVWSHDARSAAQREGFR